MKPHLQCAEQQVSRSNLTKYCACHAERLAYLVLITYETSFTVRGATGVTIQPHQILRLSRRKTRILSPHHIWNVIYSGAEQQVSRSNLTEYCALPRKIALRNFWQNLWKQVKRHFQCGDDPSMIREWSEHDPRMIREWSEHDPRMIRAWSEHENANCNPPRKWGYFSRSPEAFSIVKYNVSSPILHSNIHQVLRLPQKVTLDLHRILPLPRKVTLDLHRILPLPRKVTLELHQILRLPRKDLVLITYETSFTVRGATGVTIQPHQILRLSRRKTRILCHDRTSPNTAPATQNCIAKFLTKFLKTGETSFPMRGRSEHDPRMIRAWSENDPRMIRAWSENDPSMIRAWKLQTATPPRKWGYFSRSPEAFSIVKIQRFEPNLTFKHAPSAAPATKSNTWPSPNTAPCHAK